MEKEIKSVANVSASDIEQFLKLASEIPIRPEYLEYKFEDASGAVRTQTVIIRGAKVLLI